MPTTKRANRLRFLEAALASCGEGVIIVDAEGCYVFMNEIGTRIAGQEFSPKTPLHQQLGSLNLRYLDGQPIPPEEVPLSRALHGEAVVDFQLLLRKTDGTDACISNTANPVRDDQGNVVGAVALFREVTEQRRTEEAVRKAKDELETRVAGRTAELRQQRDFAEGLIETAQVIVLVLDREGRIVRFNRHMEEVSGYTLEEVRGKDWFTNFLPERDRDRIRGLFTRSAGGGVPTRGNTNPIVTQEGREREIEWYDRALTDADGHAVGLLCVGQDITERRRAEEERERLLENLTSVNAKLILTSVQERERAEEAQRRAAELDATFASIADAVVIYEPEGEIIRMNPAAERLLNYSAADRDKPLAERFGAIARAETPEGKPFPLDERPVLRALRGETVRGVVMTYHPSPGKTVWLSVSAAPIRAAAEGKSGVVVTFTDISALQLQEQREDFIRMTSHDLKQPLTSIMGLSEWLYRLLAKRELEQEAKVAESLLVSSRRMGNMVQEMADSARLEAGRLEMHREPTDICHLVIDFAGRIGSPEDQARIGVECPEWIPPVLADPDHIERVLANLLANALKYSPRRATITVRLQRESDKVVISVTDHGSGIPAEDLPHIFDRYYRAETRKKAEGLGLGLYISRLIVEAHEGRIWAESEVGKGSTFSFSLPLA